MSDQPKFCERCGAALPPGANFCESCGDPVVKSTAARPPEPVKPGDPLPDPLPPLAETVPPAPTPPPQRVSSNFPPQGVPPAVPPTAGSSAPYPDLRSFTPPPAKKKSALPWILGGVGCLGLLCLVLIGVGVYFFMNSDTVAGVIATAQPTQAVLVAPTQPVFPTQATLPTQAPLATQAVFPTQAAGAPLTWPAPIGQQLTSSYFSDDFSSKTYDWADVSDTVRSWGYEDQHYAMHLIEPDYTIWAYLPLEFTPNTVGFDAAVVEGYDQGAYGVICHYQNENDYYFVSVDPVYGEYSIGYVVGEDYFSLLTDMWMPAQHLNASPYAVNSVMITCDSDMITLFINNEFEAQADLGKLVDAGDTAIFGETWEDTPAPGYKVLFDNLYAFKPVQ